MVSLETLESKLICGEWLAMKGGSADTATALESDHELDSLLSHHPADPTDVHHVLHQPDSAMPLKSRLLHTTATQLAELLMYSQRLRTFQWISCSGS
jgi:hypothetical protein